MTKPNDNEAILYAFTVEAADDKSALERYIKKYPELAEELVDLASELRLGAVLESSPTNVIPDAGGEAAWKEFLACKPEAAPSGVVQNPFARLKGEAFVKLAEALNVPRSFLTAFRDGLVVASSIPEKFIRRFAKAANESIESVRYCFAHPQPATVALEFKSDGKPSRQGQKTFRELVESTEMTDEQRQILRGDCDDNGLD